MEKQLKKTYKNARHILISELSGKGKILDIGYGQTPNLFLKGEVYGIDIQKINVPNYKKTFQVNLNFQRLPFKDNEFDCIVASEIIEHLENPSFLLREINRVLKEKGVLLIGTPQANYIWFIIRNLFFDFVEDSDWGMHLSNWTIMDFKRLLKRNGFGVKKMYGSHIAIPYWLHRSIVIPTKRFPKISYTVLYECYKLGKPMNTIATIEAKLGYYPDKNIEIPNKKVN